jgi:hypothetical protein
MNGCRQPEGVGQHMQQHRPDGPLFLFDAAVQPGFKSARHTNRTARSK